MRLIVQVHWNYTDCVRWMGDLILSKSVHSRVILWRPLEQDPDDGSLPVSGPNCKGHIQLLQVPYPTLSPIKAANSPLRSREKNI
jgi:hypothetical protein